MKIEIIKGKPSTTDPMHWTSPLQWRGLAPLPRLRLSTVILPMQAIIKGWVMTGQMPDSAEATARDLALRPSFDIAPRP